MAIYCTESDVVNLLGQGAVDLLQDDAKAIYPQTSTNGSFTQPAPGATVTVNVFNGLWAYVGQCIFVGGAGFYLVQDVAVGNLTLTNLGTAGNVAQGATIPSGAPVALSPLADFIGRGSAKIDQYCATMYTGPVLATSSWVTYEASIVSAYMYCMRRGNPPPAGIAIMYQEAMEDLKQVQKGFLQIPNLPRRKSAAPVMSNMRPTLRPHPHAVVETQRSTGKPAGYHQNRDPWDQTGINTPWVYDYSL